MGQGVASCLQQQAAWQRLWLWGIHATSPVLPHFAKTFGNTATTASCDRLPYVAARADWATVKLGFGSNLRTNIDRYIRRIQKDYKCQFHRVRTPEQLEEFMEDTLCDELRYERARLWMLFLDGLCVAVLQAFVDRGVVHSFHGGKRGYEKHHLGTVMLALSLRDCVQADGIDEFDVIGVEYGDSN